jgi:hypothetical protein
MRYFSLVLVIMLYGCAAFRQEAMQEQRETVGIQAGQPTQLTETITRHTSTEAQAGPDVAKALSATMAAFQGNLLGAIDKLKPQPVDIGPLVSAVSNAAKPGGMDTGSIAAVAGAGLLAFQQYMAKRKSDADADEGWRKAQEAQAREVALARQLPPEKV